MAHEIPDLWAERSRQLEDEYPWVWLYELQATPTTRYRLTNYDKTVSFGVSDAGVSLEYLPAPIVHGPIEESGEGDLPQINVTVGYAGLDMKVALDENVGFIGNDAVIRLVNSQLLDDTGAQIRFDGQVIACRIPAGAEAVGFTIASRNLRQQRMPGNRYVRNHCRWQYGGPECGYDLSNASLSSAFPTCDKTKDGPAGCTAHGDEEVNAGLTRLHPKRFGGWPSIPRRSATRF